MTYCKIYENNTFIKSVETDTSNLNTTYKSIRVTKSSIEFINKSGSTHLSVSIGKSIPGYTMADQWKLISHQNDFASYHNFPYKIDNTNSISHSIYIQKLEYVIKWQWFIIYSRKCFQMAEDE